MSDTDFRSIANARIASRLRQVFVLVLAVLVGIIISVSANAKPVKQISGTPYFITK